MFTNRVTVSPLRGSECLESTVVCSSGEYQVSTTMWSGRSFPACPGRDGHGRAAAVCLHAFDRLAAQRLGLQVLIGNSVAAAHAAPIRTSTARAGTGAGRVRRRALRSRAHRRCARTWCRCVPGVQGVAHSRHRVVDENHLLHVGAGCQSVQVDRLFAPRAAFAIPVDFGVDRLAYVIAVGQGQGTFGDDISGERGILHAAA